MSLRKFLFFTLLPFTLYAQQIVDVKSFGAVGNGFNDDQKAIEKAITNLKDGDTLKFPSGRFVVGKSSIEGIKISDKKNITIVGEGMQTHILFYYSSYLDTGLRKTQGAISVQNSKNVRIENLSVIGMADIPITSFSYSSDTTGVLIDSSEGVAVQNVAVRQMSGYGIFVTSNSPGHPSRNISVQNSRLNQNRVAGILAGNVDGIKVTESEMNGNGQVGDAGTGYGFAGWSKSWAGYPRNTTLIGNEASRNIRKGLDFHAGVTITVTHNMVFENGLYGINVEGAGVGGRITIQENHIQNMGAAVSKRFQILNYNHPVVKAEYTMQICAICFFFMRKSNEQIPDKSILIKDNIIENLSLHTEGNNPLHYGVYAFAIANFDGPNRDDNMFIQIIGNKILNSDMSALFYQGWAGDGSAGRYNFKFNDNFVEFASTIGFSQIYFHDAEKVEFKNNTFRFIDKYTPEMNPVRGFSNEDRIANVRYSSVLSTNKQIDFVQINKLAKQPNSLFAYHPGWQRPEIVISGNSVLYESGSGFFSIFK